MGAPKLRWTPEEEAALKAGIAKYGLGKWSTIVKDPEFGNVLYSRSNVDLKDKWRNITVMANGCGSRQRVKNTSQSTLLPPKPVHNSTYERAVGEKVPEVSEARSLVIYPDTTELVISKKPISRLDDLVVEVVSKLKEARGSSRVSIASYIEERYSTPSDLGKGLAASLKLLTENGRLNKVKHQYRIAPTSNIAAPMLVETTQKDMSCIVSNGSRIFSKADIDAELDMMRNMSAVDAAAAAAKAVAEAEAAVAEAEVAAREAEVAEAEAEAAQCFAEAANKALNCRSIYA